jgi:hypothetical protein
MHDVSRTVLSTSAIFNEETEETANQSNQGSEWRGRKISLREKLYITSAIELVGGFIVIGVGEGIKNSIASISGGGLIVASIVTFFLTTFCCPCTKIEDNGIVID